MLPCHWHFLAEKVRPYLAAVGFIMHLQQRHGFHWLIIKHEKLSDPIISLSFSLETQQLAKYDYIKSTWKENLIKSWWLTRITLSLFHHKCWCIFIIRTVNVSVFLWDSQRVQEGQGNLFLHAVPGVQQSHADQPNPEDLPAHPDPGTGQKWNTQSHIATHNQRLWTVSECIFLFLFDVLVLF